MLSTSTLEELCTTGATFGAVGLRRGRKLELLELTGDCVPLRTQVLLSLTFSRKGRHEAALCAALIAHDHCTSEARDSGTPGPLLSHDFSKVIGIVGKDLFGFEQRSSVDHEWRKHVQHNVGPTIEQTQPQETPPNQ